MNEDVHCSDNRLLSFAACKTKAAHRTNTHDQTSLPHIHLLINIMAR